MIKYGAERNHIIQALGTCKSGKHIEPAISVSRNAVKAKPILSGYLDPSVHKSCNEEENGSEVLHCID